MCVIRVFMHVYKKRGKILKRKKYEKTMPKAIDYEVK